MQKLSHIAKNNDIIKCGSDQLDSFVMIATAAAINAVSYIFFRSVAQPGRALSSGGRGRRFKSSHSDQAYWYIKMDSKKSPCKSFHFLNDYFLKSAYTKSENIAMIKLLQTTLRKNRGGRYSLSCTGLYAAVSHIEAEY